MIEETFTKRRKIKKLGQFVFNIFNWIKDQGQQSFCYPSFPSKSPKRKVFVLFWRNCCYFATAASFKVRRLSNCVRKIEIVDITQRSKKMTKKLIVENLFTFYNLSTINDVTCYHHITQQIFCSPSNYLPPYLMFSIERFFEIK